MVPPSGFAGRSHGSVVYLHGVGGPREGWSRPVADSLAGLTVELRSPTYDDLLTTRGRVYAQRVDHPDVVYSDGERASYVARQHRLRDLIDAVGEATTTAWPAALPRPAEIADRLPVAPILRTPLFGLDQVGRYLDDDARRAAVIRRVSTVILAAPRPRVVIAHSLGSLVAWDLLADPRIEVDLLITAGSPLANAAVPRGHDAFPYDRVGAWLNLVHLLDPVPGGRGLHAAFPAACDAFLSPLPDASASGSVLARLASTLTRAATSHLDTTYFTSRTLLASVREAMHVTSAPRHREAS